MIYRVLAELVVLIHFAFILFLLVGGLLALRWRWVPWVQLPTALWGTLIALIGWVCPLTPLENRLRRASGAAGYSEGFVEHYLVSLIYPDGLTRELQLALGILVIVVNAGIYGFVWRRRDRRRPDLDRQTTG